MDPKQANSTLRFDRYTVNFRTGEVTTNATRIRLQEKPLRVLAALMERPGDLVTREELHKRLWPDATFVDFETGLNTAVKKLRAALADEGESPNYIETIPRRGYRFTMPVEIVSEPELRADPAQNILAPSSELPPSPTFRAHWMTRPMARAALSILVVVVAFAFWWVTPLAEPKLVQIYPVTTSGREDYLVRPATDGARIFFVQRVGDHYDLMQAPLSGGDAQRMDAPFRNTLIWDVAPDRMHYLITSFARRGEPSQLWSWPVTGGPPVKLDDMISGSAAYSPDGSRIAFHVDRELWIGSSDGTWKRKLGTFEGEVDDPAWSPDGTLLRFTVKFPERNMGSIWEIGSDGRQPHPVLSPEWPPSPHTCCGTWTPDGRYFIFTERGKRPKLWALREKHLWWRRSPSGPFLLASEATGSWSPLVGRDGARIFFYSAGAIRSDPQNYDLTTRQFTPFLPGTDALMPGLSRDGRWVAYLRTTTGSLWSSRLDGNQAREFPFAGMSIGFPRWSPDGRTLAFSAEREGIAANAYVVDADGGLPQLLLPGGPSLHDPDWSGDGSEIVVEEDRPAIPGRQAGSVLALVTLRDRQVREIAGSEGMGMPRWSPDGLWIAALSKDRREVLLYSVAAKKWRSLLKASTVGMPVWSTDGQYLYVQRPSDPGQPLDRVKVASGRDEEVANFQQAINSGVVRCVFLALTGDNHAIVDFNRGESDLYGATLVAP